MEVDKGDEDDKMSMEARENSEEEEEMMKRQMTMRPTSLMETKKTNLLKKVPTTRQAQPTQTQYLKTNQETKANRDTGGKELGD